MSLTWVTDKLLLWLNGFTMFYDWGSIQTFHFITKSVQKSTWDPTFHCHAAFLGQSICSHLFPTGLAQIRRHTLVWIIRPNQQLYVNGQWFLKNSVSKIQTSLSHFLFTKYEWSVSGDVSKTLHPLTHPPYWLRPSLSPLPQDLSQHGLADPLLPHILHNKKEYFAISSLKEEHHSCFQIDKYSRFLCYQFTPLSVDG